MLRGRDIIDVRDSVHVECFSNNDSMLKLDITGEYRKHRFFNNNNKKTSKPHRSW